MCFFVCLFACRFGASSLVHAAGPVFFSRNCLSLSGSRTSRPCHVLLLSLVSLRTTYSVAACKFRSAFLPAAQTRGQPFLSIATPPFPFLLGMPVLVLLFALRPILPQILRHPLLTSISRKLGASITILWGRWGLPIPMPGKVRLSANTEQIAQRHVAGLRRIFSFAPLLTPGSWQIVLLAALSSSDAIFRESFEAEPLCAAQG